MCLCMCMRGYGCACMHVRACVCAPPTQGGRGIKSIMDPEKVVSKLATNYNTISLIKTKEAHTPPFVVVIDLDSTVCCCLPVHQANRDSRRG